MKKLLKPVHYLYLVILLALGYAWTMADQEFLTAAYRPYAFFLIVMLLFLIFFFIVRPSRPYKLSALLSIILGIVVALIILIQHIIITFDISIKALIIFLITTLTPFLVGAIYKMIKKA